MSNKKTMMEKVISGVLKKIDDYGTDWLCPWSKEGMPKNIRGTYYTGINTFILWCVQDEFNYTSSTYATFNQVKEKVVK